MTNAPMPSLLPVYKRAPVEFERGEGAYLFDREGRRYLDFGTGIAVSLLGHAHPHLVAALKRQGEKLWHCSNLYTIEAQQKLADRLVAHSFADTVFFCNSGAEALECSIKMARSHFYRRGQPERFRIITFEGAFHGRTMATITAGGQDKHLEGFRPELPGFDQLPLGDAERVRAAVGEGTAAILIEPIQGESGIRQPQIAFLEELRRICDEHDLLLIFDEVQSGMGRTGKLFAYEWTRITPDIMALAKGLGGGFPIGACLATARAASGMLPGSHGSTFGGNPLACAVANAVLDVVLEDGFLERARKVAGELRAGLEQLAARYPGIILEVRGEGLLLGLRCGPPNTDVIAKLLAHGLATVAAGDNVVRVLPPLILERAQIDEAVTILEEVCREFAAQEAAR
ncbi:MAG TPA: aspartate aminotransferase family protein [Geminicoccaceae bacterium]|nr:aspartate aminotransferase family protein [Geminicoccaceae bacterium]